MLFGLMLKNYDGLVSAKVTKKGSLVLKYNGSCTIDGIDWDAMSVKAIGDVYVEVTVDRGVGRLDDALVSSTYLVHTDAIEDFVLEALGMGEKEPMVDMAERLSSTPTTPTQPIITPEQRVIALGVENGIYVGSEAARRLVAVVRDASNAASAREQVISVARSYGPIISEAQAALVVNAAGGFEAASEAAPSPDKAARLIEFAQGKGVWISPGVARDIVTAVENAWGSAAYEVLAGYAQQYHANVTVSDIQEAVRLIRG